MFKHYRDSPTLDLVHSFSTYIIVHGTNSTTKPDDITTLNGNVFLAYQNGVGATGEPTTSGVGNSIIVEYGPDGSIIAGWNITGKCDGMTADTANNCVLATVNEDGNYSMYIITPGNAQPQHQTLHL